jgi:hypothetical protein
MILLIKGRALALNGLIKLISTFIGENGKFFFMHMLEKDVLLL